MLFFFVALGLCLPLTKKRVTRSGTFYVFSSAPLPQLHVDGVVVKDGVKSSGESYASVHRPDRWRGLSSGALAPVFPFSCFNNHLGDLGEQDPLHLVLDLLIWQGPRADHHWRDPSRSYASR